MVGYLGCCYPEGPKYSFTMYVGLKVLFYRNTLGPTCLIYGYLDLDALGEGYVVNNTGFELW